MQLIPFQKKRSNQPITLRDAMNQMFNESFWDPFAMFPYTKEGSNQSVQEDVTMRYIPSIDVSETDKDVRIIADVPGFDPKNINVQLQDGMLTLQGSMQEEKEEGKDNEQWYRKECSSGSFFQRFSLPEHIEEEKISCEFSHGKLKITVPKKKEEKASTSAKKLDIHVV